MPRFPRSTRAVAGTVVLTCFGAGFAGAFGAHAIETRVEVSQARSAAQDVEAKREALEAALAEAHEAVEEARDVADSSRVAAAAHALSDATEAAAETASLSGVPVAVAPIDPDEIDTLASAATALRRAEASADGLQPVINDAAPEQDKSATTPSDEPADEPVTETSAAPTEGPAPVPSGDPSPAPSGAPTPEASATATAEELVKDLEVARVLAGETDSADEAREAVERLERAALALDEALAAVDGGSAVLSEAALEAAHEQTLVVLEGALSDADATAATAADTIAAVTDRVEDDDVIDDAEQALTRLMSASARAALVDHEEPLRVIDALDRVLSSHADFDEAVNALRESHEQWVDTENAAIDSRNDLLRDEHEQAVADAVEAHAQANRDAVAERSNGWSGVPLGVTGSNGSLAWDSLCEVDFAPSHRLQCDAARALDNANEAYLAETGRNLSMTDSYRSYSLQVITRANKPATAAQPGSSNHGWGMAVDLDVPSSAWLAANGADYGWVHPAWARPGGSKPESWHLEYVATDVGAFEAPSAPELEEHVVSAFAEPAPRTD